MIVSTEAIVLSTRKYSDSSKIVWLYTSDRGRHSFIAKGARSKNNKYGSALEPMSHIRVTYYEKAGRELHIISNAELESHFTNLTETYDSIAIGMALLESVANTQHENEPNQELFKLLLKSLSLLNLGIAPFFVFCSFQLQLAEMMGFGVEYSKLDETAAHHPIVFSISRGRLGNSVSFADTYVFEKASWDYLQACKSYENIEIVREFGINDTLKKKIIDFFGMYFSYHLDRKYYFRTYDMLTKLS